MENLIKKLERINTPEIEMPNHKRNLRNVLLSYHSSQNKTLFPNLFRNRLTPLSAVAAFVLALALIMGNMLFPVDNLAEAKEIALNNPEVKKILASGGEIKDIKKIDGKAFLLLGPKTNKTETKENFLVEVNMKERKVAKIQRLIERKTQFTENAVGEIQKILNELEASGSDPVTIDELSPIPTNQLRMVEKGGKIEVIPEEDAEVKFQATYRIGAEEKSGTINVTQETIEAPENAKRNGR